MEIMQHILKVPPTYQVKLKRDKGENIRSEASSMDRVSTVRINEIHTQKIKSNEKGVGKTLEGFNYFVNAGLRCAMGCKKERQMP